MKTKICNSCNKEKNIKNYVKAIDHVGGRRHQCNNCRYKQKILRGVSEFKVSVIEKVCGNCKLIKSADQFNKNKRHSTGLTGLCKECRVSKSKARYEIKKELIKIKTNSHYHNNKEKALAQQRIYTAKKRKTDPMYVLSRRLRNRLYTALRQTTWRKNTSFSKYIGCSLKELKNYIECKFTEGMTWEILMEGSIHLDHIIPLSSAKTENELYKLCHFTNIQPLWAEDNIKKGNLFENITTTT